MTILTKLALTTAIVSASAFVSAGSRAPGVFFGSELDHAKLQNPGSTGSKCNPCDTYKNTSLFWGHSSEAKMYIRGNGGESTRTELRNNAEFNAKTSSKNAGATIEIQDYSNYLNELTIMQLHRTNSDSHKPAMRIDQRRDGSDIEYHFTFAKKPNASSSSDYVKGDWGSLSPGSRYVKIRTSGGKVYPKVSSTEKTGQSLGSDWPSDSKYYFKTGTYLSGVDSGKTATGKGAWTGFNWN